jgi:hypothetical protein
MSDPLATVTVASPLPLTDQISSILHDLQSQAPEVLELGVKKVRTTAELQIAGFIAEWLVFLIAILIMSRVWRSWLRYYAKYRAWSRSSDGDRPDPPSDAHDGWMVASVVMSAILALIIVIQVGWYLPDQVSFLLNARYYAVLELIHQLRGL